MHMVVFCFVISFSLIAWGQEPENDLMCPGGYCVSKHLCRNGTYNDDPKLAQNTMLIGLRIDDVDPCEDYMLVCCQGAPVPEPVTVAPNDDPKQFNCGLSNEGGLFFNLHNNDTVAQYAEFPWVVYIFTRAGTKNFVCGGTLINPRLVVTTAHNVDGKKDLVARFGEWDISTTKEPYPQQEINVKEIIKHPEYVLNPIRNDIALLLLADNVRYDAHVQPICLPQVEDNFVGQRCISNGWGTVQGAFANVMKKLSLPVIERTSCTRMLRYAGLGPFYKLSDGFMCAGGEPNVDTCKGDGGSPLACQTEGGSYVLAGIVSWGIGCGGHNFPGVYVAVSQYVNWINEQLVDQTLDLDMNV